MIIELSLENKRKYMNIFVTGGTGFIGSYVVNMLVQNGHQVTILARNRGKIPVFLQNPQITVVEGTLKDLTAINKGLKGNDTCIHIALGWGDTPSTMLENDTWPSIKIFEAAIENGVSQIIYTSSTAAVGDLRPTMNERTNTRPVDLYGATKAATENYLMALGSVHNVRCNVVRPGYTFGNPVVSGAPMQPDKRIVEIVNKAKSGKTIDLIKNDGTQFIWAGDLTLLYKHLLDSDINRTISFGLSSQFITWEQIASYTIEYMNSKSEITLKDLGWECGGCWFDNSTLERYYNGKIDPTERLKEHVRYIADNS